MRWWRPCAVLILALIEPITVLVFGAQWLAAVPIFRILWIGNLIVPTTTAVLAFLAALGDTRTSLRFAFIWLVSDLAARRAARARVRRHRLRARQRRRARDQSAALPGRARAGCSSICCRRPRRCGCGRRRSACWCTSRRASTRARASSQLARVSRRPAGCSTSPVSRRSRRASSARCGTGLEARREPCGVTRRAHHRNGMRRARGGRRRSARRRRRTSRRARPRPGGSAAPSATTTVAKLAQVSVVAAATAGPSARITMPSASGWRTIGEGAAGDQRGRRRRRVEDAAVGDEGVAGERPERQADGEDRERRSRAGAPGVSARRRTSSAISARVTWTVTAAAAFHIARRSSGVATARRA